MHAVAAFDSGRPQDALVASEEGMKHDLTPAQREALAGIRRLLNRYAQAHRAQG